MNERMAAKNKIKSERDLISGFIGLFIILIIIFISIFYRQSNVQSVSNEVADLIGDSNNRDILASQILENHLENLDKIKADKNYDSLKKELEVGIIKKLEEKSTAPTINNKPFDISKEYNKDEYRKEFLNIFSQATTSGMGLEILYFVSQIDSANGEILSLSEIDIEKIYSIANIYDDFAEKVQKLKTPSEYIDIAELSTEKGREVAFLLRGLMIETDPFIYAHLFTKYSEVNSYIFRENTQNSNNGKEKSVKLN